MERGEVGPFRHKEDQGFEVSRRLNKPVRPNASQQSIYQMESGMKTYISSRLCKRP